MTLSPNDYQSTDWIFPTYFPPVANVNNDSVGAIDDQTSLSGVQSPEDCALQAIPRRVDQLPTTNVWGLPFAHATMNDAIELADQIVQNRRSEYFITANLNYLMLTGELPELAEVNQHCHCILADGNPIVWRSRLDSEPLPCRVAGSDMIVELARLSAEKGYRIFFLGGAPGVAQAAADKLREAFPNLQIAGAYSPPFRQLSPQEHAQLLQRIREAGTDILLVAFGQPKGELWIYDNLDELGVPLSIQLGASFDFLAGTAKRAPKLWQTFGCEWLYRAFSDPKRLLPRYAKNISFLAGQLYVDLIQLIRRKLAEK